MRGSIDASVCLQLKADREEIGHAASDIADLQKKTSEASKRDHDDGKH